MVKWEWKSTSDNTGKQITKVSDKTGFTVSLLAGCVHVYFSTENYTRYTHPSSPEPMAITTLVI